MWTTHCRAKVAKAKIALMQCKQAVGKTWGLNLFVIQWIYKALILPLISYGAIVWMPVLDRGGERPTTDSQVCFAVYDRRVNKHADAF